MHHDSPAGSDRDQELALLRHLTAALSAAAATHLELDDGRLLPVAELLDRCAARLRELSPSERSPATPS